MSEKRNEWSRTLDPVITEATSLHGWHISTIRSCEAPMVWYGEGWREGEGHH